ncbi:MAG: methyltransferase domain-containing protein [Paracoccaceae bacterium]|nr:methyltransferase domain-containing protein [Paracoccaceae bacterium]
MSNNQAAVSSGQTVEPAPKATVQVDTFDLDLLYTHRSRDEVLAAYRENYDFGDEIGLHHVEKHASLEWDLTGRLKRSDPDERAAVFQSAYNTLYAELPWLAGTSGSERHAEWCKVLKPKSKIIEIGSGAGSLVRFLSDQGHHCVGTELSDQRGATLAPRDGSVKWQATDGVHLTEYHDAGAHDHVISDQVVEHMHPDDLPVHLRSARELLRDGGSYVVRTPHRSAGPHDLSRVFGFDEPCFMHLKEYTIDNFATLAQEAGYRRATMIVAVPTFWSRNRLVIESRLLTSFNTAFEVFEDKAIHSQKARRLIRKIGKAALLPSSVWMKLYA